MSTWAMKCSGFALPKTTTFTVSSSRGQQVPQLAQHRGAERVHRRVVEDDRQHPVVEVGAQRGEGHERSRHDLDHLAPLHLRAAGGIQVDGTRVVADPRIHLVGYGPSASTIGANRAGRSAVRELMGYLGQHVSAT